MTSYKPNAPFTTPVMLLVPQVVTAKGSTKKIYPETGDIIFCSFRTFGGTEVTSNDVLVIENTAKIQTWYRPDIKADCKIKLEDDSIYDIIGEPENINRRNQYINFTIKQVKGGA